ncbi:MAG: purine-nucleoside phosphorylase [Bacteroidetes bacterium CG12_big_fil_rev_8_21_14_0_65_60_17]|nr:MAG: purine-nucleoside phosphorylase [Bacteroidetes bacterium CG12_big_fil_rev_8_21_14_0_65_60_17]
MTSEYVRLVENAARHLERELGAAPELAIVLGTGLDGIVQASDIEASINVMEIDGHARPGYHGDRGHVHASVIAGERVWLVDGRVHGYDGATPNETVFLARALCCAGVGRILFTGAVGGMDNALSTGDFVVVTDHINLTGTGPLEGPNHDGWGPRFPDMSAAYDPSMNKGLGEAASACGVSVKEGVYAGVRGPQLETAAEYRMLLRMGAHVVGMSTVHEVIACVHMGVPVASLCLVTDACHPDTLEPVSIADIMDIAARAQEPFIRVVRSYVSSLSASTTPCR